MPARPRPYLAAMRLLASSRQGAADVPVLMEIMGGDEREQAWELARRIGRDRTFEQVLAPPVAEEDIGPEEEIRGKD